MGAQVAGRRELPEAALIDLITRGDRHGLDALVERAADAYTDALGADVQRATRAAEETVWVRGKGWVTRPSAPMEIPVVQRRPAAPPVPFRNIPIHREPVAPRKDTMQAVIGDTLYAGAAAAPLCVLPPAAVPRDVAYPSTAEEAQRVKDGLVGLQKELLDRKVKVKLLPAAQLGVGTEKGRQNIMVMHTTMHSTLEGVKALEAAGVRGSATISVKFTRLLDDDGNARAGARAVYKTGRAMEYNLNSPSWHSWERHMASVKRTTDMRWHPPGGERGGATFVHEIGHMFHHTQKRASGLIPGQPGWSHRDWDVFSLKEIKSKRQPGLVVSPKQVAGRVSSYAATNAREFVAETWTGMVQGNRYDEDVMDLYRLLGGPPVKGHK